MRIIRRISGAEQPVLCGLTVGEVVYSENTAEFRFSFIAQLPLCMIERDEKNNFKATAQLSTKKRGLSLTGSGFVFRIALSRRRRYFLIKFCFVSIEPKVRVFKGFM